MGVFDYQIEQISVTYKSKYNSGIELSRRSDFIGHVVTLNTVYICCIHCAYRRATIKGN